MRLAGFKPAIPASKWVQTHALNHVTTGIGIFLSGRQKNIFVTRKRWLYIVWHAAVALLGPKRVNE
jgi:hypothetical protein